MQFSSGMLIFAASGAPPFGFRLVCIPCSIARRILLRLPSAVKSTREKVTAAALHAATRASSACHGARRDK